MDISTIANLIDAVAKPLAGAIFAAAQIRRDRQSAPARCRASEVGHGRSRVRPLPPPLRRALSPPAGAELWAKIREVLGPDGEDAVYLVSLTLGKLSVLLRLSPDEVTLDLRDDFFSGPLVISLWRKLKVYSVEECGDVSPLFRETGNEWFHWPASGKNAGAQKNIAPPDSRLRCAPPLALAPIGAFRAAGTLKPELMFRRRMCDI